MNAALVTWIELAAALVGWASASAAVLIMGAWLMRKALGSKLGLGWRTALGWLVVLRLLCLAAPESRWSWRNLVASGHLSLVTGHRSVAQTPCLGRKGGTALPACPRPTSNSRTSMTRSGWKH